MVKKKEGESTTATLKKDRKPRAKTKKGQENPVKTEKENQGSLAQTIAQEDNKLIVAQQAEIEKLRRQIEEKKTNKAAKKRMDNEKLAKLLITGQYNVEELEEIGVSLDQILELKNLGYRVLNQQTAKGKTYYITTSSETASVFISGKSLEMQIVRYVELSDLHFGSRQHYIEGMRFLLDFACELGFKEAHISGDICDGFKVYPGHQNNLLYFKAEDQADFAAAVLGDYPIHYYAITGNHDYSYEKLGGVNPLKMIETEINTSRKGATFSFLDSFSADLIICGVAKRMVHLDGGRTYSKSYPAQTYLRNLVSAQGLDVRVRGNKYPLRLLQGGHFHSFMTMEDSKMQVTTSGNFQLPNPYTERRGLIGAQGARFTTVYILNGEIVHFNTAVVYCTPDSMKEYKRLDKKILLNDGSI